MATQMTNSQRVELLYGTGRLDLQLPADATVTTIRKPSMPVCESPEDETLAALARPVGPDGNSLASLADLAAGKSSACIAICDITRPVPNHLFLRPVIESLHAGGIPFANITVLVATGLHRPNLGVELDELLGDPWVREHVQVSNHDALDDSQHVDLGHTATRGTPVKIDRRFVQADVKIATGLVEPHFMAGYSGGRKVIAPGLAHADTIRTFHNHAFMSNPAASNCNLVHNPLHEEQLEILKLLGGALAVNTVIDERRQLSFINFGEILTSHAQAVTFIESYCRVPVDSFFETVITSSAGYPLDKTYYQTVKGMVGASGILAEGGELFIASECSEGLGSNHYVDAQRYLTANGPSAFLDSICGQPLAEIDAWQTQMQTKATSIGGVTLYSALDSGSRSLTGIRCTGSQEAFERAIAKSIHESKSRSVAVIPEGPYVIPFVAQPSL